MSSRQSFLRLESFVIMAVSCLSPSFGQSAADTAEGSNPPELATSTLDTVSTDSPAPADSPAPTDNAAPADNPTPAYDAAPADSLVLTPVTIEAIEPDIVDPIAETIVDDQSDSLRVSFGDWLGYDSEQSDMTWLGGSGFGMFSIESFPTLDLGNESALVMGTGFHFLNGPTTPEMPPRLFDFQLAYHSRKIQSSRLILDIKVGIGAFSDFEGSARKGIRFPGHVVSYFEWDQQLASVLGIDVLDRDDISVLPVAGFVWSPNRSAIYELIFPRPKIQIQLDSNQTMYIGGELGGGTWAIERDRSTNDNATYRDIRVTLGVMYFNSGSNSVLEIGWAFDRELEYRSGVGDTQFDDAFILRCRTHY